MAAPLPLVMALRDYPLRQAQRPTTDAAVYVGNLRGRLEALDRRADRDSGALLTMRASTTFELYQIEGRLVLLDRAAALAKAAVTADPGVADAWLIHAQIQAHLHAFDGALHALGRSEALKAPQREVARLRTEIAAALGNLAADEHAAGPRTLANASDAIVAAHVCVQMGNLQCASELFHQAQFLDNDPSPLPLAWLHTQQGVTLLRFGHPEAAIPFFRAALERLPGYYVANEHLAECLGLIGAYDEARSHYEQVIAQTSHPEYMAGYAGMLRQAGDQDAASEWQQRATDGYARLLESAPAAYAGHAIGFYLEAGNSSKALNLAERNIAIRQDVGSWLLLAEARVAAGQCDGAVQALAKAKATGWRPPEFAAATAAVNACSGTRQSG